MLNPSFAPNPVLSSLSVGSRYHRRRGGLFGDKMKKPTTKDLARFLTHVHITKSCWLWTSAISTPGYGHLTLRNKEIQAHRLSYELFVGHIPQGKLVLHKTKCNNKICVNPRHLYLGTYADNARDKIICGDQARGEQINTAKLTKEDILFIRKNKLEIKTKELASRFGINRSTVNRIIRGDIWKHLLPASERSIT